MPRVTASPPSIVPEPLKTQIEYTNPDPVTVSPFQFLFSKSLGTEIRPDWTPNGAPPAHSSPCSPVGAAIRRHQHRVAPLLHLHIILSRNLHASPTPVRVFSDGSS
jgi:hypothetical protein